VQKTAVMRNGNPQDIGAALLSFAKEPGFITSQMLSVDGGRLCDGLRGYCFPR
jgi:NAD(P)-dependent dehydrogenase (short-subunit alcohol dehydrogenase family)